MFKNIKIILFSGLLTAFLATACGDDNNDELPPNSNQLGQECYPDEYTPNCQGMNARNCIEVVVEKEKKYHVNDAVCSGAEYKINGTKAACRVLTEEKWAGCYVDCKKIDEEIQFNEKTYICTQGDGFMFYREKDESKK